MMHVPPTSTSPHEAVEAPARGHSLHVLVVVGDPGAALPSELTPFVIGMLDRGNGGQVALVGIETPFDQQALEGVENGSLDFAPWEVPGLRAEPEPFGWIVDVGNDGTRRSTEFSASRRKNRRAEEFSMPDFPGRLRPWAEKPTEVDDRGLTCAVLIVPDLGEAELFVDFRARCDHLHLAHDARKLVEAARRGEVDHGWHQLENGDWVTGIGVLRVMAELGGLTDGDWAAGPKEDDDPGA